MRRVKATGFAAGLLCGLAGITWHRDWLVWSGIGILAVVFALRFVKRGDIVQH